MTQEELPALSNQNDEEAARDEKGPEIFILSLAQDTRASQTLVYLLFATSCFGIGNGRGSRKYTLTSPGLACTLSG